MVGMNPKYTKDEIELVIARLEAIPDDALLAIGDMNNDKPLTKEELIKNVREMTDIGSDIIEMQLSYVRSHK